MTKGKTIRNEVKMKKIASKINENGFNNADFLYFKNTHKEIKKTFKDDLTSEVTLRTIIATEAYNSFSIILLYVYVFIFFSLIYLITDISEGKLFFIFSIITIAIIHFLYNIREKNSKVTTEFKLIKLYLRSYF